LTGKQVIAKKRRGVQSIIWGKLGCQKKISATRAMNETEDEGGELRRRKKGNYFWERKRERRARILVREQLGN